MDEIDWKSLPEWDAAEYLTTPLQRADYLSLVMEDGDEAEIAHALAAIARARAKTASRTEAIDESGSAFTLTAENASRISGALLVVKELGLKLNVLPVDAA